MKLKTLLLTLLLSSTLNAQTYVYVTDAVDIPMRSANKIQSNPSNLLRMLPSGTKLQLLSTKDGWAQVRLGESTGWMISRYLTSVLPAKTQLEKLKIKIIELEGELRRVKKKYGEDQVRVISNNTADLNHEEKKYSESLAKDIAFCAGDFDFAAAIFSDIPTYSEKLKGLSRGWEFGSWGLYFVTGYEMEAAKIFAKGKKEVKFNEWLVKTEGANPDKLGNILDNELTPRLKHCSSMKEIVIESQDVVRKLLFGRKEQNKRALTQEIQAATDQERKIIRQSQVEVLKVSYINQIAARVKNHWRYAGAKGGWGCDVYIIQDTQGNVKSVNIQSCSVSNKAKLKSFRNSIERAVNKASPLPSASDKGVFNREILFYFRVD